MHTIWLPLLLFAATTGVAFPQPVDCATVADLGAWYYDWSATPTLCAGVEAVPMIWGADLPASVGGNSAWLMGSNEPDRADQAHLTPEQAARLWRQIETRWPERRLVSPAPSAPGLDWLQRFRLAYVTLYGAPPRLDALAVHCYLPTEDCRAVVRQAEAWAAAWSVGEIWLTEWSALPCHYASQAAAVADADALRDWLRMQPRVTRTAWFAAAYAGRDVPNGFGPDCDPSLTRDGALTAFGAWWVQ